MNSNKYIDEKHGLRSPGGQAPASAEILTVEGVATLLQCSPDTVRRVPRDRLPVYRVGKRNLYLREDVIRFVRSCRVTSVKLDVDSLISEIEQDVLGSAPDGVRERSRRRTR